MNYRQMQGMIRFHRSAELGFRATKNHASADAALERREGLEKQAHALEVKSFQFALFMAGDSASRIEFEMEEYEIDEGALTFAVEAYLAMEG